VDTAGGSYLLSRRKMNRRAKEVGPTGDRRKAMHCECAIRRGNKLKHGGELEKGGYPHQGRWQSRCQAHRRPDSTPDPHYRKPLSTPKPPQEGTVAEEGRRWNPHDDIKEGHDLIGAPFGDAISLPIREGRDDRKTKRGKWREREGHQKLPDRENSLDKVPSKSLSGT